MAKHLFILLFFTGVVPLVLSVTHKYILVQKGKPWNDAKIYCQTTHTDLAIIKSDDDMVRLQNEAQSQNFASRAWIGMYTDVNSWHWSLGYEPLGTFRIWDQDEPNNRGGTQSCSVTTTWGWWDVNCAEIYPFVCFDETKTGNDSYIYISIKKTWNDAQAYCRQYHTDLASVRNIEENSIIQNLISSATWFGLYKDPWKWIDHSNVSTISWMYGQPDNDKWDENCAYLYKDQASDAQCSKSLPFFCYSEISEQQIIRMKIQSNQDLNDPAVNEAILEKIKQKLKDHGMEEEINVKWRVKPDGVVFHKEN